MSNMETRLVCDLWSLFPYCTELRVSREKNIMHLQHKLHFFHLNTNIPSFGSQRMESLDKLFHAGRHLLKRFLLLLPQLPIIKTSLVDAGDQAVNTYG